MSTNPKEFSIIPTDDELSSLPRDLRFHPASVESARRLSAEQVAGFNERGYVKPLPVLDSEAVGELRGYFDDLLAKTLAEGGNSYSISSAHLKHGRVWDLLTSDLLVDYVSDLLGPDVVAWGAHFFCKMPGDGKAVAWHQDASYWPLSPSKAVTLWLAIDDADLENGCMKFIAGSHHHGHLTYRKSEPGEHNVLDQTVDDPLRFGEEVVAELKAGECSIHSDLLLHGSDPNRSERRRCGLTLRYASADVRSSLDWSAKGIVVRGSDPEGHWGNPPRPAVD